MSANYRRALAVVAKETCRELRKTMTAAERVFWQKVRNRKFMGLKFHRQHPIFIHDSGRETFAVADFYCHEERLVVEIDGKLHDFRKNKDRWRTELIERQGIMVVRYENDEVENDPTSVLCRLSKFIWQKRGLSPGTDETMSGPLSNSP